MEEHVYRLLLEAAGKEYIAFEEPMREHTTFRVGGNAEVFIAPDSIDKICRILDICREYGLTCHVIGNGSYLLVGDRGVRGVVLQIYKNFSDMSVQDTCIWVQAGALLAKTAVFAAEHGLTGLEFASGIPGTVGGAVTMNAGAYGGEMKDVISQVRILDPEGKLRTFSVEELQLGYRASLIQKQGCLVVEAELALTRGEPEKIYGRMEELKAARKEKQPIEFASAGSTFKRPEGHFAGALIEKNGLKGAKIGGAMVSEKHAGFIVNVGSATAGDILELIARVQRAVLEKDGVALETEVRVVGEEPDI